MPLSVIPPGRVLELSPISRHAQAGSVPVLYVAEAYAIAGEHETALDLLDRLVAVEHGEWPRLAIAFFYFFFLLGGYFMLRPLRGTVAANNSDILHWLYTATFVTMLAIVPAFGFVVSRYRRSRFIPGFYQVVDGLLDFICVVVMKCQHIQVVVNLFLVNPFKCLGYLFVELLSVFPLSL